jgi:hypothetical protein
LGVEVGPHTTVAYGVGKRLEAARGSPSIAVKASDHGWALPWTFKATKSSCGPDTKTPGCTQLVGALVAIEVPVGPVCGAVVAMVDKVVTADVDELVLVIVVVLEAFVLCLASVPDVKRSTRIIIARQTESNFGAIVTD